MKTQKLMFFDMEFTGLHKEATPISIGVVLENGAMFYGEFSDYDKTQCDEWITENVLRNTIAYRASLPSVIYTKRYQNYIVGKQITLVLPISDTLDSKIKYAYGSSLHIMTELFGFLLINGYGDLGEKSSYVPVTDVGHYDMVLLIDFMAKNALEISKFGISPTYFDINQLIAGNDPLKIPDAFDYTRMTDEMMSHPDIQYINTILEGAGQHNALIDAMMIKILYKGLKDGTIKPI